MSDVVLILGESGSGKSRSVKGLPPDETFIINATGKKLPFKGSDKIYKPGVNLLNGHAVHKAAAFIKAINKNRPNVKYIVIDDNQYFSMFTYIERAYERDYYSKYLDMGVEMVQLVELCKILRDDITVFFLHHIENGVSAMGTEQIQAKTMGKFVKEKITYEGLFPIVLLCDKEADGADVHHFFWTRMANSTVKTPEDMFSEQKIDNDLKAVADQIHKYYN